MFSFDQKSLNFTRKVFNFKYAERSVKIVLIPSDHIFEEILYSTDDKLKGARRELEDIVRRRLPKCVGETRITKEEETIFAVSKILVFTEL